MRSCEIQSTVAAVVKASVEIYAADSMKAYVVNMARSPSRRASVAEQLARTQLDFEFVDGIDGNALTPLERAKLVSEDAVERSPRWLTPGQIGCALSHLHVYERMAGDISLVFEDDVVLPPTISEICARVAAEMHGKEVVLLYFRSFAVCRFSARDAVEIGAGARLMYPIAPRQPITSAAYLITSAATQSLAEAILPVRAGADGWGHFYELDALDSIRCLLPRPVGVRKEFKSTIDYVPEGALYRRASRYIATGRPAGLSRVRTLNRRRIERRMSRTAIVPERSPIALGRTTSGA